MNVVESAERHDSMIENFNRCLGCMKTIGDASVCPKCGYIKGSPVASPHLPPGTILTERYLLGKVSSSNGEGAVYISFDTKIETAVDIKEYAPETLCERAFRSSELRVLPGCEPKYKALMYDFIELYRQLAHMRTLQNIQKVFHVFEQNNTVYVVMEHISGVTLKQYISDRMGELTVPDALRLFEPVFPVLSTLHRADIIHRGISPDTILVTKNEEIKLCGFAISPVRASGSELSPMLYRGYAAPEQYSPNSSHAPYTDVYSLAAVMYKTITGTMPPEATGRSTNDNFIAPSLLNTNIPRNVSHAITNSMNLSPQNRTQTIDEFFKQLTRINPPPEDLDSSAKTGTSTNSAGKQKKPRYALAAVSVSTISLIVIAGVLLYFIFGHNPSSRPRQSISPDQTSSAEEPSEVSEESSNVSDYLMPDLIGRYRDDVRDDSRFKNLLNITWVEEFNNDKAEGVVFEQSIKRDEYIEPGEKVTVKVSKGRQFVKIPSFKSGGNNMPLHEYHAKLAMAGITKYEFRPQQNDGLETNLVASTNYAPGSTINRETPLIVYYVFNYPEPPDPEDY